jgi:hypothetical protein
LKKRLALLLGVAFALAISPAAWTTNAHAGWSWNAQIASVSGDVVTLENSKGDTLTVTAIDAADPVAGADVTVVEKGLVWDADGGDTVEQTLGWSWND